MDAAFRSNTDMQNNRMKSIPVEFANSMTEVKQYYSLIRPAQDIHRREGPDIDREDAILVGLKAVNDAAGPKGVVSTLQVFGALSKHGLPTDGPSHSTF